MYYLFPTINHINDVLPHIEGREEFIVAERDFGKVVNYMVEMPDTFTLNDSDDIGGIIRRECRGIKFYPDGKIAARPFHKFFNIGQKEETQPHLIDINKSHIIMDKRDGSMLHPMIVDGSIRWMTKMGITEVSEIAEKFISNNVKYNKFAQWCIEQNLTPIFEYTGPKNQIVISYQQEELTLLAVRHMITGQYLDIH